jgi:DNA-binding PadR family transcriptional regulator
MSIKHGLLALLRGGPMYGYQLRSAFEESTGGTWPLNIGQVYTTLGRLERDGLVRSLPEHDGQREYEITATGRDELAAWFTTPVSHTDRPRDELAIKLSLALRTPGVDIGAVVQGQRTATMRTLQEYTRLKATADPSADLSWLLVVDAMLFQAEAEIRWLDHCETTLVRHLPAATASKTTASKTTASKATASKTTPPQTTPPQTMAPESPAPKTPRHSAQTTARKAARK